MPNPSEPLPQNIEAEQAVLGSMLIDSRAIDRVEPFLRPEDFYLRNHADIYRGMLALYEREMPTDIVTLSDHLQAHGQLDGMGGAAYLASLGNLVPTSMNAEHYARIVERLAVLRRLVDAGTRIQAIGYDGRYEVGEALEEVDRMLKAARSTAPPAIWEQFETWMASLVERLAGPITKDQSTLPTGLGPLDAILKGGLRRGHLIIVGARSGTGKTSFCTTIAHHVGVHLNLPVLFFTVEMTRDEMGEKLLSIEANLPWDVVTSHDWTKDQAARITAAGARLGAAPIEVVEALEWTTDQIRQAARVAAQRQPLSLIIVDYLQEMEPSGRRENRTQDVGAMASSMKKMAMELDVPALVPAQMNRQSEQHGLNRRGEQNINAEPKASELRESGGIENVANVVLILHLPDEERNSEAEVVSMTVIVGKNRMGRKGKVRLGFRQSYMQFVTMAPGLTSSQPRAARYDEEAAF